MSGAHPALITNKDGRAMRGASAPMSWPCAAAAYLRGLCATLAARP